MENKPLLCLAQAICLSVILCHCSSLRAPISQDSSNPLDAPGASLPSTPDPYEQGFAPGTFALTNSPSTPFFNHSPRGNDQPSKIFGKNHEVKIIASKSSYSKVEVIKTGEVGFIPSIMLIEKSEITPLQPDATPELPSDLVPQEDATNGLAPEPEIKGLEEPQDSSITPPSPSNSTPEIPKTPSLPDNSPSPTLPSPSAPELPSASQGIPDVPPAPEVPSL